MPDRAGLAGDAAALDLDHRVEVALGAGDAERHPDVGVVHGVAEVLFERAAVDDDLTLTGEQSNAGNRGLATAGAREERRCAHGLAAPRQASGSGRWA